MNNNMYLIDALPAGPDLDVLVAEQVMGWKAYRYEREGSEHTEWLEVYDLGKRVHEDWHPSTDISAAFTMVERLRTQGIHLWSLGEEDSVPGWTASMGLNLKPGVSAWAWTAPLALSRAALKVVGKGR